MSDLKQRLGMSAVCILFLIIFVGFAPYPYFRPFFTLSVAVVVALALWEFYRIAKIKGVLLKPKPALSFAVLYVFAVYLSTEFSGLHFLPAVVLSLFLTYLFLDHFGSPENALISIGVTFFGFLFIAVTLSCLILITYFFEDATLGRLWLIYLLAVTKMTDVGGLFIGRFFGKRKLLVTVSPNKTVEGAIGGVLLATLTSVLFATFTRLGISALYAVFLGIILSVFGQIGDLAESLLKRDGGIKDSNPHFPGLGGVFDLIDSLIFTTPVLYLFLKAS